jgi:hypothetical protein
MFAEGLQPDTGSRRDFRELLYVLCLKKMGEERLGTELKTAVDVGQIDPDLADQLLGTVRIWTGLMLRAMAGEDRLQVLSRVYDELPEGVLQTNDADVLDDMVDALADEQQHGPLRQLRELPELWV